MYNYQLLIVKVNALQDAFFFSTIEYKFSHYRHVYLSIVDCEDKMPYKMHFFFQQLSTNFLIIDMYNYQFLKNICSIVVFLYYFFNYFYQ